jgi:hypothetical protein
MSSLYGGSPYKAATGGIQDLKGTGYKQITTPTFDKNQMKLFKDLFSQVGRNTQLGQLAGGDQSAFGQLEAPALQQFSGLLGGLGSRFSGMGGLGARNSSGFQNTATNAASNFAQQLQAQRLGIQNQARNDLFSMSQQLLGQRPYEQNFFEKPLSFGQSLLGSVAGGFGQGLGMLPGLFI